MANERLSDIVQELLNASKEKRDEGIGGLCMGMFFKQLANRIDAAKKRECEICEIRDSEVRLRRERADADSYWFHRFEKQAEVFAETARQNVRLKEELAKLKGESK